MHPAAADPPHPAGGRHSPIPAWVTPLYLTLAAALIPWIVYLDHTDTPAGPARATPLLPADLRAMVATLDLTSAAGLRDRAVILLGWAMAARRSEIAGLNIADVREAERGLRVTVRRSKTD